MDLATKQDIAELTAEIQKLSAIVQKLAGTTASEILSIKDVERMGVLGKYDRIKRLIRNGHLKVTSDGKITRQSINEYLSKQDANFIQFDSQMALGAAKAIEKQGKSVALQNSLDEQGRPTVIKSFYKTGTGDWEKVLVFDWDTPKWADDQPEKFCKTCPIASYAHPMVKDPKDSNAYFKLCALDMIKEELITIDEIFEDIGGCGAHPDDRAKLEKMLGINSDPKPENLKRYDGLTIHCFNCSDSHSINDLVEGHCPSCDCLLACPKCKTKAIVYTDKDSNGFCGSCGNTFPPYTEFDETQSSRTNSLADFQRLRILERVKDGGCGGSLPPDYFLYMQCEKEGIIKLLPDQPDGIYQARLTPKGRKLYNKLTSK